MQKSERRRSEAAEQSETRARRLPTPRLQLKCFTAIEILHLAWLAKKSVEQTLMRIEGRRTRFAHRRRRGDFPQGSPQRHRQGQGIRRGISGRSPHLASPRRTQHLHDAVRPRRIARRPRGSSAAIARVAGRDARLRRLRAAAVSAGEQRHPGARRRPRASTRCAPSP